MLHSLIFPIMFRIACLAIAVVSESTNCNIRHKGAMQLTILYLGSFDGVDVMDMIAHAASSLTFLSLWCSKEVNEAVILFCVKKNFIIYESSEILNIRLQAQRITCLIGLCNNADIHSMLLRASKSLVSACGPCATILIRIFRAATCMSLGSFWKNPQILANTGSAVIKSMLHSFYLDILAIAQQMLLKVSVSSLEFKTPSSIGSFSFNNSRGTGGYLEATNKVQVHCLSNGREDVVTMIWKIFEMNPKSATKSL